MTRTTNCSTRWRLWTMPPQLPLNSAFVNHTKTCAFKTQLLRKTTISQRCFQECNKAVSISSMKQSKLTPLAKLTDLQLQSAQLWTASTVQWPITNLLRAWEQSNPKKDSKSLTNHLEDILVPRLWHKSKFCATLWLVGWLNKTARRNSLNWTSLSKSSLASACTTSTELEAFASRANPSTLKCVHSLLCSLGDYQLQMERDRVMVYLWIVSWDLRKCSYNTSSSKIHHFYH